MDATAIAKDWTARRVAVPLKGRSAVLTLDPSFPPRVRLHALFAAKVASANALEDLRQSILGVLAGDTTPAAAAQLLRERFAGQDAAGSLLKAGRAEQIIRQQAMMAYAVGERATGMDPAVLEFFPNWKYVATRDNRVRDTHAALDGLVLPKTDPFWRTHTPPWEYGCRCALVDAEPTEAQGDQAVTRDEADGGQSAMVARADGRIVNLTQPASGFVFEPDAAFSSSDMGLVSDLKSRRTILAEMVRAVAKSKVEWHFVAKPETGLAEPVLPRPEPELRAEIARVADGTLPAVSLGKLLPAHTDGLGLTADEHEVRFSQGTAHYGVMHWQESHPDTFAQPFEMLSRTLWQPGAEARMSVKQARKRLLLWNRDENLLCTLRKLGDGWDLEAIDVWRPAERYRQEKALE